MTATDVQTAGDGPWALLSVLVQVTEVQPSVFLGELRSKSTHFRPWRPDKRILRSANFVADMNRMQQ